MGYRVPLAFILAIALSGIPTLASRKQTIPGDDTIWCRNPEGRNVEWFIMYKVPKTANTNKRMQGRYDLKGSEYGYVDAETPLNVQAFADGVDGIFSDRNNPLANSLKRITLRQKVRADKELAYVLYNDQPPHELSNSTSNGHTKGVVIFGEETGIWIVHSVPRFPEKIFSGKYSFPPNARENGQTILCVTFGIDKLDTVAAHLRKQYPNIYAGNAPSSVRSKHRQLDLLLNKKFDRRQPYFARDTLTAINGTSFTAFAKGGHLNKDVYSGLLAPTLETDLFVESWRNGNGGKLPPDCFDKYKVTDVQKIAIKIGNKTMRWNSQEDHSKWAVGDQGNWVCIGSINRMLSQFKRGGETICLQNIGVHSLFARAMAEYASCNIDGIKTRLRTQRIEDLVRDGDSKDANDNSDKPTGLDSRNGATESPQSALSRKLQDSLRNVLQRQAKNFLTELEGVRAVLG